MLTDTDIDALRTAVRGTVRSPGDPGFDTDTASHNLSMVHRPDAVLAAADTGDVQAAVSWAGRRGIPLAVQSTGHAVSAAMGEGLLINTGNLQDVRLDTDAGTATVGAGTQWRQVLRESVPLGLTGAHGSSGTVGTVGYTSGGGLPLMGRALGFGSDHVLSMEVVTADGRLRHVEPDGENAELFTVLRGGKGSFGIITSMTFGLTPFTEFYGGGLMFPEAAAAEVLEAFLGWTDQLPADASASLAFLHLPDVPFLPEELRGTSPVHLRFALFGSQEEGDLLLAPMRAASTPFLDTAGPLDYLDVGSVHMDPDAPMPVMERGTLLSSLPAEAAAELVRHVGPGSDTPLLMAELRLMGGALADEPAVEDAVSGRRARFHLFAAGLTATPVASDQVGAALVRLDLSMEPYANGSFINMHGPAGSAEDRQRAWEPAVYSRLQTAKAVYDPQDLFRFGHAVPLPEPSGASGL